MINYYNFISIYVGMFEAYINAYFQDSQYGLFALFFALIFERNSFLMKSYMKANKKNLCNIPFEKGRDVIIDTWKNWHLFYKA